LETRKPTRDEITAARVKEGQAQRGVPPRRPVDESLNPSASYSPGEKEKDVQLFFSAAARRRREHPAFGKNPWRTTILLQEVVELVQATPTKGKSSVNRERESYRIFWDDFRVNQLRRIGMSTQV